MLVDPVANPSNSSISAPTNISDLEEYLNTELFGPSTSVAAMSPGPSGSSRASSPSSHSDSLSQILSTPPQPVENSFPAVDPYSFLGGLSGADGNHNFGFGFGGGSGTPSFFNFLDEEMKVDPSTNSIPFETGSPFDFMSALGIGGVSGLTIDPSTSFSPGSGSVAMAIDPQLVDSPSTHVQSDFGDDEDKEQKTEHAVVPIIGDEKKTRSQSKALSPKTSEDAADVTKEAQEKLTVTITPVKVGGHGKARKGTVQSGGVTKRVVIPTTAPATVPIPLPVLAAPSSLSSTSSYSPSTSAASLLSRNKENVSAASPSSSTTSHLKEVDDRDKDDDDDLPADWRPPPEVFAKMSSKEKRQLRNKISARNFRVRRKEYISTLEMDIAERDRLLQAIRSELGSTQSENLALRQEVAALKRALLDGRGATSPMSPSSSSSSLIRSASPALIIRGADVNLNSAAVTAGLTIDDLNLPPPAPLPERSAAEELALRAAASGAAPSASTSNATPNILTPNIKKDLPTSPRLNNAAGFWGGVSQAGFGFGGMGGGFTPVHTVLMPDLNTNMNVDGTNISIGQWVRDVLAANAANLKDGSSSPEASPKLLQENMNPVMNVAGAHQEDNMSPSAGIHNGFEGFVDTNPFTMKSLDAYRMQLWTKMAASSSHQASHPNQSPPQQPSQPNIYSSTYAQQRKALERELSYSSPFTLPSHQPGAKSPHSHHHHHNLTTSLKPAYFVNSNKPNLPSPPPPKMGSTLSALLAGKHSTPNAFGGSFPAIPAHSSLPSSSNLSRPALSKQQQQQQMQQAQNVMYAALASTASQTLVRRLGNAFWDAFSGSSSGPSASGTGAHSHMKPWDADKVRKVLEGKAVIKVVDVDEPVQRVTKREPSTPMLPSSSLASSDCDKSCSMTALLEDSMRTLSLGKK
ncbi:hypothetical protein F5879DRAFT_923425 [Lentinula edodes]|nr:hypothetical protein F5879DRAFT_923425 [Lentinula edodes]